MVALAVFHWDDMFGAMLIGFVIGSCVVLMFGRRR